jgi:pyrophosphatase PpaX
MAKDIAVLFDLDGTLIDSNEIIIESYMHAFKVFRPDLRLSRETVLTFIGPTLEMVFKEYVAADQIEPMIETYRAHYVENEAHHHHLYPGVIAGLVALKQLGAKLSIVTSKYKAAAWRSFTHYQLEPFFDAFVALDDVTDPKPNKEAVNVALKRLGGADWAIMIGDNPGDIQSGLNAGIEGAGVGWSIKGKAFLQTFNPHVVFDSMDDIVTYVAAKMEA